MTKTEHNTYLYSLTEIQSYPNPYQNHTIQFIQKNKCPECNNTQIHHDNIRDELICRKCGLILQSSTQYSGYTKIQYPFNYKYHLKLIDKGECKNTCLTVEQTTK